MALTLLAEAIYTFIILVACAIIRKHTKCLFELSGHNGIKYFERAFDFWGIGFLLRFILILFTTYFFGSQSDAATFVFISTVVVEYFLSMGAFFLVYSLIWRHLVNRVSDGAGKYLIVIMHALALALALADAILHTIHFMYIVQIIALGFVLIKTFIHWHIAADKSVKHNFASLYLIAICAAFFGYLVNYLAALLETTYPWAIVVSYVLTCSIFVIVLFGVLRIAHSKEYCEQCCLCMRKKKHGKKTRTA